MDSVRFSFKRKIQEMLLQKCKPMGKLGQITASPKGLQKQGRFFQILSLCLRLRFLSAEFGCYKYTRKASSERLRELVYSNTTMSVKER